MKLRYFFLALGFVVIMVISIAGFRGDHSARPPLEIFPDMNYQDKVKDQVPSAFFADGIASRLPVPGTVALEMPAQNDYWATGKWDETHWGDGIPAHDARDGEPALQVDAANMARGRERYTISCEACHGAVGDGQGIVTKYGLSGVASYQNDRLRQASDGDIFNTITNGKGQMLGYGYNIAIDDRWRIIMYLRALQRSQMAAYNDASTDEQAQLDKTRKPPPAPAGQPAPAAPTSPPPSQPGQPAGPTAPAPTGSPSPTQPPPSTNSTQPAPPGSSASTAMPGTNASVADAAPVEHVSKRQALVRWFAADDLPSLP